MAIKPTIENARWGETAAGVVGGNDTAPASGQRDTGWALNQLAVSSYFNRIMREHYLWCLYLSDGILSGSHTFTSETTFEDNVELQGTLDVNGSATVGGDATITGNLIAATLSHTAQEEHHLPALAGKIVAGTNSAAKWSDTLGAWVGVVGEVLQIPLAVRQKDRIHSVSARVLENADKIQMRLWRVDASTATPDQTQVGTTQTSATGGSPQTLTISGLSEDVGSLMISYYVELTVTAGSGGGAQVFGTIYNVSHPVP